MVLPCFADMLRWFTFLRHVPSIGRLSFEGTLFGFSGHAFKTVGVGCRNVSTSFLKGTPCWLVLEGMLFFQNVKSPNDVPQLRVRQSRAR